MNSLKRFLKGASVIGVCLIVVGCIAFLSWSEQPLVSKVKVSGLNNAQKSVVKHQLGSLSNDNWFRIDLDKVQKVLQQAAGIDQAIVSRGKPFILNVHIKPQKLAALWNQGHALNQRGQVIRLPDWCQKQCQSQLPHIHGFKSQHRQLLGLYQLLQSQAKSAKLSIETMNMDQKGVVTLTLSSGLQVTMGSEQDLTRWQHFVKVYPEVFAGRTLQGTQVDLRYTNGMAVHWGKQHG